MIVAVVGCGNEGANLLLHIADIPAIDHIFTLDISENIVKAAIRNVAGTKPIAAHKIKSVTISKLNEADVIFLSAGVKIKKGKHNGMYKRKIFL